MTSIKELTEVGKELGYVGEELRNFVKQEQDAERERRKLDREAEAEKLRLENEQKKIDREAELEKIRLDREAEAEKIRLDREAEAEKIRLATEAEERKMRLEIELARKRVEAEKELAREQFELDKRKAEEEHKLAVDLRSKGITGDSKVKGHKLPFFDEDKDNIDSYLLRFERYADLQGWKRDNWSVHLSALLKGKALDVYSRLSASDALDYDKLKDALLQRFEMTEEGFRRRFRSGKPEKGETFVQYVSRAKNYLQRWFQLAKVEETYKAVVDFLLRDQLLSGSILVLEREKFGDCARYGYYCRQVCRSSGWSHESNS